MSESRMIRVDALICGKRELEMMQREHVAPGTVGGRNPAPL